jgi:hypothetical protein
MAIVKVSGEGGGEEEEQRMKHVFGPGHADAQVRQALQMLWFAMPANRRNVDEVEREFRRLVERALKDLREDSAALGE